MKISSFIWSVFTVLLLFACTGKEETPLIETTEKQDKGIKISLADAIAQEGDVAKGDSVLTTGAAWLEYEIEVPISGRYRISFETKALSDSSTIWVEDHVHNTEGRTYNISGSIEVPPSTGPVQVFRDGSPLKAGKHSIRIHTNGHLVLYSADIKLLVEHQKTPLTLIQNMDGDQWEQVWSDEFEGIGTPDTNKWTFDIGNWGWGNGELQYYTSGQTENARMEDGHLVIEARKKEGSWTSARLTTRGKTSFIYGKIEFRAKVPAQKGNWAAGWTLGDEYVDESSWPYCGEIDILESVGYQMDDATGNGTAHASVHCSAYYFKLGNQPTATIDVENMNNSWHLYSIIWTPESIEAYVDDELYFKYTDNSNDLTWPFSKPQNLILNLTMGGGWGGLMGMDPSVDSQKMLIDYVRVYQKSQSGD